MDETRCRYPSPVIDHLSIVITILVAAAVFAYLIWARQKEAHHLDDLHIVPGAIPVDSNSAPNRE